MSDRPPATVADVTRWHMKALELVRRMHAVGADPAAELERLQRLYDKRDTEKSLELPRPPLPTERPTRTISQQDLESLRKQTGPTVLGVTIGNAPRKLPR